MVFGLVWSYLIVPFALIFGSLKLAVLLLQLVSMLQRQFLRGKLNHLERYGGKGTWALVTGATDGIGLEFCMQLARSGFNICLVSRTESKLEAVTKGDISQFGVELKIVVADFSQGNQMSFYDNIMSQVKDLDIGLVIINAGVAETGGVADLEAEKLQALLDVNVYQYSALAHKFAAKLEARKAERSGLLLVSSIAAELPGLRRNVVYGATKVFVKYLCMCMGYENSLSQGKRSKIDVLCLQPGFVKTKMIKAAEDKGTAMAVVSTEECVSTTLRDLGSEICTYGPMKHERFASILGTIYKYASTVINKHTPTPQSKADAAATAEKNSS